MNRREDKTKRKNSQREKGEVKGFIGGGLKEL